MAIAAPGASAAPWQCDAYGYLFQAPTGAPPGIVQQIDLATGQYSTLGNTTDLLNGVAYNTLDNYFYAYDYTTDNMVRVEDDLTLTPVVTPPGFLDPWPVGDFDDAGHYWTLNNSGTTLIEIDYAPGSPTFGQIIHQVPTATPAATPSGGADFTWINGFLYRLTATSAGVMHLVRVDPSTGAQTDLSPGGLGVSGYVGATYADANGYLYGSDNTTGTIYRVDPQTLKTITVSTATAASANDGARCASAVIPTVTVKKVVDGRVRAADQFTVGLDDAAGTRLTSATTSGAATTASTTDWPVSQGKTYRITDAMAGGSPTPLGEYVKSIQCVDSNNNPVPTGGSAGNWTLNVANATYYTCTVTNSAQADVAIAKSLASSAPLVPGTNATYQLKVTNNGPSTAVNASASDPLPAGTTYVSADAGCAPSNGTVTCSAGDLAPGASKTFNVTARINSDVTDPTITNTATARSDTPDPTPGNNTGGHGDPVDPRSDLRIVKHATSDKLVPGRQLTYQLIVTNDGPSDAKNLKVSDPLPKGLTFVSASNGCTFGGGTVTCTAPSLAVNASTTFEVVTKVAGSVADSVTNKATVSSDTKDPDTSNNTDEEKVPAGPQADLSLDKVPAVGSVSVGGQLFYTLIVKNHGPSDARKVTITDNAGPGLTLVSARTDQGTCTTAATKVTCDMGTVAADGTAQVLVSARADQPGALTNSAHVDSATDDPDPKNNDDRETVTGHPGPPAQPADLEIVKTSNHKTVTGSGTITYTLTVVNHGPGAATGVQVIDTPSLPIKVKSVKATVGKCATTVPITCDLGTLASGAKATITVVAQPKAAGTLKNSASVTGDVPDPKTDNNLDGTATKVQGRLTVTKVASARTVVAGGTLSYRIRVTNASAFAVKAVKVCDDLPSGLVYVSSSPRAKLSSGKYCWTVATLGAKKAKSFTIKVRALKGAGGRKVNVATATAPDARGARSKAATDTAAIHVKGVAVRGGGVTG
jgi:uncharacterized repeat protein (TIGR01451 family)